MRTLSAILAAAALAAMAPPALSQPTCTATGEYCANLPPAQKLDGRNSSGEGPVACKALNPNPADRKIEYDFYISFFGFPPMYYCSSFFTCDEIQGMSQTVYNYDAFCP